MLQSLGGRAPVRLNTASTVESRLSFADPSVSLASAYIRQADMSASKARRHRSVQVYYAATNARDAAVLARVARVLKEKILTDNHVHIPMPYRIDVYALPLESGEEVEGLVERCVRHQAVEIEARAEAEGEDWVIQSWDLHGGDNLYERLLVIIDRDIEDWAGGAQEGGERDDGRVGGILVMFERTETGRAQGALERWIRRAEDAEELRDMLQDEQRSAGWQEPEEEV
jgi:hypothetical protein